MSKEGNETKNALHDLANVLSVPRILVAEDGFRVHSYSEKAVDKARRIIRELAKEWEPVDRSTAVSSTGDGFIHLKDLCEAADRRRCDILVKCREIAEEE